MNGKYDNMRFFFAGIGSRRRLFAFVLVWSLVMLLVGCGDDSNDETNGEEEQNNEQQQGECETCLAEGGTWQPEASECTEDCDLQDISCYTDECPGECEDNCAYCFGQGECEEQGCAWHQEAEAMWCTEDSNDGPVENNEQQQGECETCLAEGGTWQPEVPVCSEDCAYQDISCYTESCPGECEDNCGYCFGDQKECEEQGCTWHQEAEAVWCAE